MADESVYHVDAGDVELGPVMRSIAHRDALYHRSTHVLLLTHDGDVILQQRGRDKSTAPGRWTSTASGHVKFGSTYAETAVQELREETGLEGIELRELGKSVLVSFSNSGDEICRAWTAVFAGQSSVNVTELRPEANEVERFEAFPLREILEAVAGEIVLRDADGKPVLFSPTFASAISRFGENLHAS